MRRFLLGALAVGLCLLPVPAVYAQFWGRMGNCNDVNSLCVGPGGEYTTICGATCSSQSSDCVAGSAIKAIKDAALFSETNPYTVIVSPGLYRECIAFNDITDVTLYISKGATIAPTVISANDTNGGVVRIANSTTNTVERITIISDGVVRNDAFNAPEGALSIGPETPSTTPKWNNVVVIGGLWAGNHDAIHITGDTSASDTEVPIPAIELRDLRAIGGADTIVKKSSSILIGSNVRAKSWSNYCETTDSTITDRHPSAAGTTKTVDATGADATHFTAAVGANATDDAYTGRHGTLIEPTNAGCTGLDTPFDCCTGAGAGTCDAGVCNGGVTVNFWVTDYVASSRLLTTTALGFTPTANCEYQIDAVANASQAPCHAADWSAIRATGTAYWKETAFHFGSFGTNTAHNTDLTQFSDSVFEVETNDYGPTGGSSACSAQQEIAGILGYSTNHHQNAVFNNCHIRVVNNTVMRSSTAQADNLCPYPLGGIIIPNTVFEGPFYFTGDIRVDNTADPGATDYGIAVASAFTTRIPDLYVEVNNTAAGYAGTTKTFLQAGSAVLALGNVESIAAPTATGTLTFLNGIGALARGADIAAGCTGNEVLLDTGGGNKELCICDAGAWACVTATTAAGPTN